MDYSPEIFFETELLSEADYRVLDMTMTTKSSSPYVRKKNGLPPKEDEEIAQNDPLGMNTLKAGKICRSYEL